MRRNINQIRYGAFLSYFAIGFNIIMGIVYTPWMIKRIGQADYGLYGIATSVIAICTMDFGLGQAVARFIAKYYAEDNEHDVRSFLGIAIKAYILIDLLIVSVLTIIYFFLDKIYISLTPNEIIKLRQVYIIMTIFTGLSFPFQALNGIITAREKFVFQKIIEFLNKAFTVLFVVLALIAGGNVITLVLVNSLVGLATAVIKLLYLLKNNLLEIDFKSRNKALAKEIFSFSIWATTILILQRMLMNICPSILGITSGSIEISIFTAASNIEGYAYTLSGAISGLFLTRVSFLIYSESNSEKKIEELMIKIGRIQFFIISIITVVFIGEGREFVALWLGEAFNKSYEVGICLIFPLLITATLSIAETALTAVGKLQYRVVSLVISSAISVFLAFFLSRTIGALGAAIGVLTGNIIGDGIVRSIIYSKVLKLDIVHFYRECHLKFLLPMLITLICAIVFNSINLDTFSGWLQFGIKSIGLVVIYCILVYRCTANEMEKGWVNKILRKYRIRQG